MEYLLKALPIAIPVILVILIFLMGYVKAPPDVAYIISGLRKHPKVLIGRAGVKIPFLERVDIRSKELRSCPAPIYIKKALKESQPLSAFGSTDPRYEDLCMPEERSPPSCQSVPLFRRSSRNKKSG